MSIDTCGIDWPSEGSEVCWGWKQEGCLESGERGEGCGWEVRWSRVTMRIQRDSRCECSIPSTEWGARQMLEVFQV